MSTYGGSTTLYFSLWNQTNKAPSQYLLNVPWGTRKNLRVSMEAQGAIYGQEDID